MPLKINGSTSGSVTLAAPATGSDVTLTLPVAGFGKVLQVVRATDTTARSTTSTSYVDMTGMTVTITPQQSTSQMFVIYTAMVNRYRSGTGKVGGGLRIATSAGTALSGAEDQWMTAENDFDQQSPVTIIGYHAPGSTSSQTYKVQFFANASNTILARHNVSTGQLIVMEVAA